MPFLSWRRRRRPFFPARWEFCGVRLQGTNEVILIPSRNVVTGTNWYNWVGFDSFFFLVDFSTVPGAKDEVVWITRLIEEAVAEWGEKPFPFALSFNWMIRFFCLSGRCRSKGFRKGLHMGSFGDKSNGSKKSFVASVFFVFTSKSGRLERFMKS